jgi:hypothetical protein
MVYASPSSRRYLIGEAPHYSLTTPLTAASLDKIGVSDSLNQTVWFLPFQTGAFGSCLFHVATHPSVWLIADTSHFWLLPVAVSAGDGGPAQSLWTSCSHAAPPSPSMPLRHHWAQPPPRLLRSPWRRPCATLRIFAGAIAPSAPSSPSAPAVGHLPLRDHPCRSPPSPLPWIHR